MTTKSELITIRDAESGDINFILATWLRGLKYGNDWFQMIDPEAYFLVYQKVIEAILQRPDTVVKVACLVEDRDVLIGYSVYAGDRLDWLFVKKNWRNIGVARSLVPENINVITHLTAVGKTILRKHPTVKFNPFAVN